MTVIYHWQELSQVSFLLRQKFVVTNICCNKTHLLLWQTCVCHDKTSLLSQQKYACHDKTFVLTYFWQIFVATNIILSNTCLSWQIFLTTNILLGQKYICHDKCFVMATTLLLQQKTCFVMTNMFVVTAVATDSHNFLLQCSLRFCCCPTPSQTMGFLTWPTPGKAPPPPTSPHHYCLLWSWVKLRGTLSLVCSTKCLRQNDS